jgi:ABC-type multidrug transport system ATPase subunit
MMSLLQPPPEVFDLFDDVMLLSEGQVVYHGPREQVMPFFNNLGFAIPKGVRMGVADFLQEVTSRRDQQQYWSRDSREYHFMPITQMHQAYIDSTQGKAQLQAVEAPALKVPKYLDPLVREKYALGAWGSFKALLRRDFTLMRRNSFLYT